MPDQTLNCSDCSTQFTFTEGEQTFFQEKGFTPRPLSGLPPTPQSQENEFRWIRWQ